MNKLGYYWKSPHFYNPRKVRFIDPTTRQIISYSNPIPCDTSHSGLSLVNRTTTKINPMNNSIDITDLYKDGELSTDLTDDITWTRRFTKNKISQTTQDAQLQALIRKFKFTKLRAQNDRTERQNLATKEIKSDDDSMWTEVIKKMYFIENEYKGLYNYTMDNMKYISQRIRNLQKYKQMTPKELINANKTITDEINKILQLYEKLNRTDEILKEQVKILIQKRAKIIEEIKQEKSKIKENKIKIKQLQISENLLHTQIYTIGLAAKNKTVYIEAR